MTQQFETVTEVLRRVNAQKEAKKRYRKSDIQTRCVKGRFYAPCVNVKAHGFPSSYAVATRFDCDEGTAEKALEYAFQSACRRFWEEAQETFDSFFANIHNGGRVFQDGRCGGWLCVEGLPDVEAEWDAIMVTAWGRFEENIKEHVAWLCSEEQVFEDIEANRWAEPGSRLYNFCDTKDGQTICYADVSITAVNAVNERFGTHYQSADLR